MIEDLTTVVWKEFKEILHGASKRQFGGLMRILVPVALAGVALPLRSGAAYFRGPVPLFGLAWILPMVSISISVDAFAGERERRTLETLLASRLSDEAILLGKLVASVLFAWSLIVASLVLAVITLNLTHPAGTLQIYSARYAAWLAGFGLLVALFVCTLAVLVSLRASTVRQASQNLALGMMAIYFTLIFGFQALAWPQRIALMQGMAEGDLAGAALIATVVLLALNLALLGAAKARFKRARLILD